MKRLVALLERKPGMSVEDFRTYYETRHAPLISSFLVPGVEYRRTYVDHSTLFGANVPDPADQPGIDCDVITTLSFPTEEIFTAAMAGLRAPENAAKVAADEENFIDRPRKRIFITNECFESHLG